MAETQHDPQIRIQMLSQARFLSAARSMIANLAQRLGFNEIRCGQISLAVDEALCNIINHGYEKREDGLIWMDIHVIDGDRTGLKIVIEDEARQVDPCEIKSRDLDDIRPGGLGVYIIREIMDEVRYEKRENAGMRLTLVKWLPLNDDPDKREGGDSVCMPKSMCQLRSSIVRESDARHERK
jgi:serine/threonine-protein kinase RsbW